MKKTALQFIVCSLQLALCAAEIDLAGVWTLQDCERTIPAEVPGGIHDALLKAGEIADIYKGRNETEALWAARRDWTFSRTFEVDAAFLAHREIVLRLEDCDTFCTVKINGREAGRTSDRFRRHTFNVKPLLKEGANTIEGFFRSPVAVADERRAERGRAWPMANVVWAKNQALVRKNACHAGWDWAPEIETIGFCGTVKLIANDKPRIDYIYTTQTFNEDLTHCTLDVFADLSDGSTVTNRIEIANPPLWWPNGAGEQNFYTFTVDVNGEKITRRIGLRKLEVLNERTLSADGKDELSLVFRVNNRRIFMKGANWIPCDAYEMRQTPARYRDLLESTAAANMNMLRVWGGGQYEKDVFYDLCDELGILVWHDMMCACAVYPGDEEFLGEISGELAHQLRRLRDHASIALWCGDNECLGAINWFDEIKDDKAFYRAAWMARSKLQGEMVARYDPARTYWPSSPCCGPGDFGNAWKDDSKGDMHQWDVWHENEPFERYYSYRPRFCSEFGYQSFPSLEVAATFCDGPGDDFEWHQKNDGGNRRIRETMRRYFGEPRNFESELVLSQFQQAMAIKTAVEAWRSEMPRCMGTLYWQLNDTWPVSSWSSIEYGGRWKPLHYAARRFYANVAIAAKPSGEIVGINDTAQTVEGDLALEYWTYSGSLASASTNKVALLPGAANIIGHIAESVPDDVFLVMRFGDVCNDWHFRPYKYATLAQAKIDVKVDGTKVTLSTDKPAFFVWVSVPGKDVRFSDNCITLLPGRPVTLTASEPLSSVRVRSLADTLAPRPPQVKYAQDIADGRPAERWRGFNITDLSRFEPAHESAPPHFVEDDFVFMREHGFNFARIPLDYRFLEKPYGIAELDRAVALGRANSIHVQICLHRIPGYCASGPLPGERSIFSDDATLEHACKIWERLAARYKGIPNEELSFNLFNEPDYMDEAAYARASRALAEAIRKKDPSRFIIADGLGYGRIAPRSLEDLPSAGFGWHCYDPFGVTHYLTPWNNPEGVSAKPVWPLQETPPRDWLLQETFRSKGWADAISAGAFVYVGEFGVWRKTPHEIALGLMEDQLSLWRELSCGWALWNLRGEFGVMDSNRADVDYESWRGHKLDRAMLDLLKKY
ncbi:MAG: cellulase family glycosylhydrolase [Kiritimatiellae bacterium]|nr:cellulase family glycosylhydrolase [Kiritimatiellia bacterium]